MKRLHRHFVPVVGLAILAILLTAVPRSLKAIAATLVQVVNTTANPAITQQTSMQASQLVTIRANVVGLSSTFADFHQVDSTGLTVAASYVTPPSQFLVITSIDVLYEYGPTQSGGPILIYNSAAFEFFAWTYAPVGTNDYTKVFPSGIAVGPGIPLEVSADGYTNGIRNILVTLHGYLTAN
jgi:hypothetical protein